VFRLALGRCIVFVDEPDQTLGRRDSGSATAGLSGRLHSMIAQEMSDTANLGTQASFGVLAMEPLQQLIELGYDNVNESKIVEIARRHRR
jgi:hypothetical protein